MIFYTHKNILKETAGIPFELNCFHPDRDPVGNFPYMIYNRGNVNAHSVSLALFGIIDQFNIAGLLVFHSMVNLNHGEV
ncbi:hypothetical protein D3C87_49050 [compost metagenome]